MAFTTKKSLLAKVRAGDEVSWREFYDAYRPLILLCGGDFNLNYRTNISFFFESMHRGGKFFLGAGPTGKCGT